MHSSAQAANDPFYFILLSSAFSSPFLTNTSRMWHFQLYFNSRSYHQNAVPKCGNSSSGNQCNDIDAGMLRLHSRIWNYEHRWDLELGLAVVAKSFGNGCERRNPSVIETGEWTTTDVPLSFVKLWTNLCDDGCRFL